MAHENVHYIIADARSKQEKNAPKLHTNQAIPHIHLFDKKLQTAYRKATTARSYSAQCPDFT